MANRHLLRTVALQSLFEWDFHNQQGDLDAIVQRTTEEFAGGAEDASFAKDLVDGVLANITDNFFPLRFIVGIVDGFAHRYSGAGSVW